MTDIGFLPVQVFLAAYFLAYFLRAPRWLQLSISIPMALTAIWSLVFGLHIRVPTAIGRPMNQTVPLIAFAVVILVLGRAMRGRWRRREPRLP